jgi:monooxygenase
MAFAFGYTNQSWTLGADLTCEQVCKLLEYMDRCGYAACVPRNPDSAVTSVPFADLTSGYVLRAIDQFPKQGSQHPWQREQNYARNWAAMRRARIEDPALEFSRAAPTTEFIARDTHVAVRVNVSDERH